MDTGYRGQNKGYMIKDIWYWIIATGYSMQNKGHRICNVWKKIRKPWWKWNIQETEYGYGIQDVG